MPILYYPQSLWEVNIQYGETTRISYGASSGIHCLLSVDIETHALDQYLAMYDWFCHDISLIIIQPMDEYAQLNMLHGFIIVFCQETIFSKRYGDDLAPVINSFLCKPFLWLHHLIQINNFISIAIMISYFVACKRQEWKCKLEAGFGSGIGTLHAWPTTT